MYVNADSVYIEEIPSSVAKKMIIEKHYTHAFSMCRYALGIYYVGEQDHKFYDGKETKFDWLYDLRISSWSFSS